MKITDIYSWVPEKVISLEALMSIFNNYKNGVVSIEYSICEDLPQNASQNVIRGKDQLIKEGKKVAFIMKDCKIVALVGYQE